MTTYNTGNALGSSDARDLYDNAENIDNFANGAANTYTDRLGVTRKSLAGMNAAFDDFIESSGYTVPVSYASGIALTAYNQLVEYDNEFYKLKAGQAPYTMTGTWGTDSAKLVAVGDAALRQELSVEVSSKRFVGTATDDAGTPDAIYKVERTHALATSPHGFRDETILDPSANGVAAAAYDSAITTAGSRPIDHIIGHQSRNVHAGTGQLSIMYGGGSWNIADGPITTMYGQYWGDRVNAVRTVGSVVGSRYRPGIFGTVVNAYGHTTQPALNAGSAVTNYAGFRVESPDGSGTLQNEFGFYCKALTKGSVLKHPIYIEATSGGECYIATKTRIDEQLQIGGNARMSIGGTTSSDFPAIHYNWDPRTNTYIASADASGFRWGANNFAFRHALAGTAGSAPTFTDLVNIRTANDANYGALFAGSDNTRNLGISSVRWKEIFSANGTINTSDAREKTPVRSMTDAEIEAAKDLGKEIGVFQFLESVSEKGDSARMHIGMTVQRAIEIMQSHGLDPMSYSFICYDKWDAEYITNPEIIDEVDTGLLDERGEKIMRQQVVQEATIVLAREAGDRYGFRANELLLFVARGFEQRISELESANQ